MPITTDWVDKSKTLIQCRFQDPWTIEQFINARRSWHRMIKSMDSQVPIVLDLSESHTVPNGALRHLAAIHRTPHPRQGPLYVTGLNPEYEKLSPFVFWSEDSDERPVHLVDSIASILNP